MQIERSGDKIYFVYDGPMKASEACSRLIHLNPHICHRGGKWNAVVVDLNHVKPMGEA